MRVFPILPALLLMAAGPVAMPGVKLDAIIAEAADVRPENLAFDRASNAVRHGGGTTTTTTSVDRWNGRTWTLVSIGGKPPSREQRQAHAIRTKGVPVPGYHRVAPLLVAATSSRVDAEGRTIWQIPVLPPGSVFTDSGDISSHLKAEARLARSGDRVWIDQIQIREREAFKMNMLIKVNGFAQTIDFVLGNDNKPRLVAQGSESSGTMFGFPGGEKALVTFTYR